MSKIIFAVALMGLMAVANAGGPNMRDGTKRECEISFKCYDKCQGDDVPRLCFFSCMYRRFEVRGSDQLKSQGFYDEVNSTFDYCNKKRGGNVLKVNKCGIKKVKKDACRWYFREQKASDKVLDIVEKLGI